MLSSDKMTPLSAFTDSLGETLHLLQLKGTLYCRSELTAPWGIDLPQFSDCMMFHIVTEGHLWLEVENEEPVLLRQGSLALVPHGTGHIIRSEAGATATPLFDIPVEKVSERYEIMRYGNGGDFTHLTCGVLQFDQVAAQQLIALLPKVLKIESWDEDGSNWLHSTLQLIASEAKTLKPGGEMVMTHLADILVIQVIRSWIESEAKRDKGWLAALRDKQVGKAIAMMHREPEKNWSVNSLATTIGMSRSGFSARFSDLVGESAIHYLTKLRMQLAHTRLQQTSDSLSVIADSLGYQSESAFSRAFKRVFGVPPGNIRLLSR